MTQKPITTRPITFFLPDLHPTKIAKVYITIANKLVADGYKVELLLFCKEGEYLKHVNDGIRIFTIGQGRVMKALFACMKYIKQEQPFVILSSFASPNLVVTTSKYFLQMTRAYVPWIAINQEVSLAQSLAAMPTFRNKARNFFSKWFYEEADVVAVGSEDVASELVRECKVSRDNITVIHNYLDVEAIQKKTKEHIEHGWFVKMRPAPVIVTVADLNSQNDYSTLLHALKDIPRVRLAIVADGPEKLMLEDMCEELYIQDRVEFIGRDPNPYKYIAQSDLFVSISISEVFPNILIEALACGASIVSTNSGSGPGEILDNGKFGRLMPVQNVDGFIDAIEGEMVAPVATRAERVERANSFNFQSITSKYYDFILSIED